MFIEIMIYILITFGILIITMTLFERDIYAGYVNDELCVKKENIKIEIRANKLSDEEETQLINVIENGTYNSIYDIASSVKLIKNEK